MTGTEIVKTEWFTFEKDSKPVRIVKGEKEPMIPLVDIAGALGYDRTSLNQMLDRNKDLFDGMRGVVVVHTPGGPQEHSCLNRDGVVGLLMKLDYHRIRNGQKRKKVIEFQKWAIFILSGIVNGNVLALPQPEKEPNFDLAIKWLKFMKEVAALTGATATLLYSYAMDKAGFGDVGGLLVQDLVPLQKPETVQKQLPPPLKPKDYLTATDIAKIISEGKPEYDRKTAEQINKWLYNNNYIVYDLNHKSEWRLTQLGHLYGEERAYEPSAGVHVWRIYWKRSILERMNIHSIGDK
jgi:hypothetical protein